jgi:hypothetical protein
MESRRPFACSAGLCVAGAYEKPIRPGLKACRVAQLRKVPPDAQQRLLRRVFGEVEVAKDPMRYCVEPATDGHGEAREGLLITALCLHHEFGIHASFRMVRR